MKTEKLTISSKNPNYLAKIVTLSNVRKHSNADRLQCVSIDGNNVITSLTAKDGDYYVYFPLESMLNKEFVAYMNGFSVPEENSDKKTKGFFSHPYPRVKCLKLRGEKSEGYIHPFEDFAKWLCSKGITVDYENSVGKEFDTIGDIIICEKYVNPNVRNRVSTGVKKDRKRSKKMSKLVEHQFRFHVDTEQLKKNVHKIQPSDEISISFKMHGTSNITSKVLCKRKLKWYEKTLKKIGIAIDEMQYDYIYSSRSVIKNSDVEHNSYYDTDVWSIAGEKYKNCLEDGITIYSELVGYTPKGSHIQKSYDYGAEPNTFEMYVYRITLTTPVGKVYELSTSQIQEYCLKYGLKTTPVFFKGLAKDVFPELSLTEHWHENFLKMLQEKYNEKKCFMCKNNVPEEGIVLRKESMLGFFAFKLKSFAFLEGESKQLDTGEANIEDEQSVPETVENIQT